MNRAVVLTGLALAGAAAAVAGCASSKPPVASYGPPPPVREPTPSANEELALLLPDQMTDQEQQDLQAIHTVRYEPPPDAKPPPLDAPLEDLLRQEGSELIHEKVGYDIPIVLNDRVEWWIDYFVHRIPDSFERYLMRSGAYLPYLKDRLREAGLPEDLAYLVMIESGFSTGAVSRVGAVGPWQFMPYTGREYGLRIDRWVDERLDYERATSAAIAYLSDLHSLFGSWYLAAAGYNGGQGRVGKAMLRDNTINFWELTDLANETKNYVPKLIAATLIAKEPEKYGFDDVQYLDPVDWSVVTVPTSTSLAVVARAAEVSPEVERMLNPQLLRGRTPPGETNYPVKIPADQVETFTENYYQLPPDERLPKPATHLVRRGETLSGIASAYGVDRAELMRENGIRNPRSLQVGAVLKIPGTSVEAGDAGGSPGPRYHVVRRGETLGEIARRFGVRVLDIKRANGLKSDVIRIGQRLEIP